MTTAATTALIAAEGRSRYRTVAALCAGTFVFLLVLAGTYTALGGASGLAKSFGKEQPAFLSAFAGARHANLFAPENYVAFGFLHPLFLVLTLAVGISIGTSAVAGDIEAGRVELLYTRPIRRTTLIDARIGAWLLAQVAVVAAAVAGAWLGTRLSQDLRSISPVLFLRLSAQYLPVAAFFGALAFAASSVARTRGHAIAASVGVAALAYLLNFIALLWHPIAWVQRITPFGYYSPLESTNRVDVGNVVVLLVGAGLLIVAARWWVERRDLI